MRKLSRRGKGALVAAGLLLGGGAIVVAAILGWFTRPMPWQQATGWDRIPAELKPSELPAWSGDDAPVIRWLGHSGFVIRWKGAQLLLDPNTSARCTTTRRILEPALDVATLGHVDAVLVSHAHFDHLDLPTLRRLDSIGTIVVPRGADRYLREPRFDGVAVTTLEPGQCADVAGLEICGVVAEHNGNRIHPFSSSILALGYVIRSGSDAIYFAGDTGARIDADAIRERFHPRLAILPIGAWLPRIPMKWYHLSPAEAASLGSRLGVETVIPCHFGTFRVSADRPWSALPRFAEAAHARGVSWRMPRLLTASETAP